jgi:hypothetical protein
MEQTAVDWLFEKLWDEPKDKLTWYAILQQAKELEKEQIMDAHNMGYGSGYMDEGVSPEDYYEQTFKNK